MEQGPTLCLKGPGGSWGKRKPESSFSHIRHREVGWDGDDAWPRQMRNDQSKTTYSEHHSQTFGCRWKAQGKENQREVGWREAGARPHVPGSLDLTLCSVQAPRAHVFRGGLGRCTQQGSWIHQEGASCSTGWNCLPTGGKVISAAVWTWGPQIIPSGDIRFATRKQV